MVESIVKMNAVFLGGSPVYEKDKSGKKTDKIISYIVNFMEIDFTKENKMYAKINDLFVKADVITPEDFAKINLFDLCTLSISLKHLSSKPDVVGLCKCDDKTRKVEFYY